LRNDVLNEMLQWHNFSFSHSLLPISSTSMDIERLAIEFSEKGEWKDLLRGCYEHALQGNHPPAHNAALHHFCVRRPL